MFIFHQNSLELLIESLFNELDKIEEVVYQQVNSIEKSLINYKEYEVFKGKTVFLQKENIGMLHILLSEICSTDDELLFYRTNSYKISNSTFIKSLFHD